MSEDFTDDEIHAAEVITRADTKPVRSVTQILSALELKRPELERLNVASTELRRSQLADLYDLLLEALNRDEEAQEAFGRSENQVFSETGGKLLNGLIKRHTGVSKQRACCLAKVLRYAVYSRISRADFPQWLAAIDNLDKVAVEYTAILRGESGGEQASRDLKAKLGDGWDKLTATLQKVHSTGQTVAIGVRIRCAPGGTVDFIKKLPKPRK